MRARLPLFVGLALALLAEAADVAFRSLSQSAINPSLDFSRHTIIKPKIFHGREKRQISTTRETEGHHIHDLTIRYDVNGREYILDLRLNRELIPANFSIRYQRNGKHVVSKPELKEIELCQYVGHIRGIENSWAAISTCNGLRGMINDGVNTYYIQEGNENSLEGPHFLYNHKDLATNHTCGYVGGHINHTHNNGENDFKFDKSHNEFNRILRYKRDTVEAQIRGPYNANKQSRYVELVLVVDNKEYNEIGDLTKVYHRCKDIANIINSLYTPLNIFIALVGVVVWTETDEISLSKNGDTTLTNFLHYRRERLVKDHPNDNAQLLTREEFDGGVVGKALKGPICTFEFSGGVAMDHSNVVGLVATTIAHEMGHNFGMEHDTEDCECPEDKCIMSPSSSNLSPTHWSSCSLEYLALAFEHGMDYCLKNKPTKLFDSPVCGNGFVEPGEQCDCGLSKSCNNNYCCNPATCMLYPNATCATGECCDLKTCRPSSAGVLCRSADHECDLPEYCTGQSEFCPNDIFKMDTETCDGGKAFCYQGSCRTRTDQCKLLWGPSGQSSDDKCYEMNKKGTRHGNCGYNKLKQQFFACNNEHIHCGMLHCRHLNERLEFGMESVAILSHSFINNRGSIIPCRTAIVDLGLNQIDPGLVPDGAKCGDGKMCVNQKCMSVASLRLEAHAVPESNAVCPSDCSGRGVCNSLGHCHCNKGYGPPLCEYPGPGGSIDSGPASDPDAYKDWVMLMCIFFSGVITMGLLLAILTYYSRHNVITCWQKTKTVSSKSPSKIGLQHRLSRGTNCLGLCSPSNSIPTTVSSTTPRLSPDDMNSSLLPSQNSNEQPSLNNNFFGHFKGFTLAPLQKQEEQFGVQNQNFGIENEQSKPFVSSFNPTTNSSVPQTSISNVKNTINKLNNINTNHTAQINGNKNGNSHHISIHSPNQGPKFPQRSAPPIPSVPSVVIKIPNKNIQSSDTSKQNILLNKSNTSVNDTLDKSKSIITGVESSNVASMTPALPSNNINTRPMISNPILETSTCTAKELISPLKNSGGSFVINKVPLRTAPSVPNAISPTSNKRPLSSPNSVTNAIVPEENSLKKTKDGISLNRIASFLKQEKSEKSKNTVERSNSLPKNPNHQIKIFKNIDKSTLKTLEISKPILINEIDVPSSAVPVVSDSEDLEDPSKMVIMRAQSMRGTTSPIKPNIPTFGSMRQPSGLKRPTSIPVANRPTSPPPPRPDNPQLSDKNDTMRKLPSIPSYRSSLDKRLNKNSDVKSPEYDDCIAEKHAPLANINEEMSPDNIYAIIEESPPHNSENKTFIGTLKEDNKNTPVTENVSSPKIISNPNSTSSESMGLLGEIVSEIQNRNFESIYSTSTLARKKKQENAQGDLFNDVDLNDSSNAYANTQYKYDDNDYNNGMKSMSSAASTTSSGYLNPALVNVPVVPPNLHTNEENKIPPSNNMAKLDNESKPFTSTFQRSLGPFATSYIKGKILNTDNPKVENDKKIPQSISHPDTLSVKTNAVSNDKKVNDKKIDTSKMITSNSVQNINNSKHLQQSNSPDLVSSCASTSKSQKSPDLVSNNTNQINVPNTKISGVNQGVILKPTMPSTIPTNRMPTQSSALKPPNIPTPKPSLKPASKTLNNTNTDASKVTRSAPLPPNINSNEKKKIVPPRPNLPKVLQYSVSTDKSGSNVSLSSSKSSSIEKNLSNITKINNGDTEKQKSTTKPPLVKKNSDSALRTQSSSPSQKTNISSKPSNVASLQQKFEPPKITNKPSSTITKK